MALVRVPAGIRASRPASGHRPDRPPVQREAAGLDEQSRVKRFEETVMAHLDAAYGFARWLTRDERNAEDIVQEACLRAFRFLDNLRGDNARAWLLAIVRNTYYTSLKRNQVESLSVPFDEETMALHEAAELGGAAEELLHQQDARRLVNDALDRLPEEFREVIVLRELEDLSYREIARIAGIPLGTVMSRLARARKLLLQHLQQAQKES